MPIRPENRGRYPADWDAISDSVRFERARGQCECTGECGTWRHGTARCRRRHGDRHIGADGRPVTTVLTTAHLDHTPENCNPANLRAMCQGCHLGYDRGHHAETAARTRRDRATAGMTPLFPMVSNRWLFLAASILASAAVSLAVALEAVLRA